MKIKAHSEKATVETPSHVMEAHATNERGKQKKKIRKEHYPNILLFHPRTPNQPQNQTQNQTQHKIVTPNKTHDKTHNTAHTKKKR